MKKVLFTLCLVGLVLGVSSCKQKNQCALPEAEKEVTTTRLNVEQFKDAIQDTVIINRQKVFSEFDNIGIMETDEIWELHYSDILNRFIQTFGTPDVYEVGCGSGRTFEYFYLDPNHYHGIDPSKKAIAKFKEKHPELANRLYCSSFEESVNYWSKSNAVILATFGAASYFMRPYLKILAESGLDYFLMFYKEGYCPAEFQQMHHFNYSYKDLQDLFPKIKGYEEWLDYRIVSSRYIRRSIIID